MVSLLQMLQPQFKSHNLHEVLSKLFQIVPGEDPYRSRESPSCRRCAVVGNSGNLRGSSYGQDINGHDFVMRWGVKWGRGGAENTGKGLQASNLRKGDICHHFLCTLILNVNLSKNILIQIKQEQNWVLRKFSECFILSRAGWLNVCRLQLDWANSLSRFDFPNRSLCMIAAPVQFWLKAAELWTRLISTICYIHLSNSTCKLQQYATSLIQGCGIHQHAFIHEIQEGN